jgi:hypothetical protein
LFNLSTGPQTWKIYVSLKQTRTLTAQLFARPSHRFGALLHQLHSMVFYAAVFPNLYPLARSLRRSLTRVKHVLTTDLNKGSLARSTFLSPVSSKQVHRVQFAERTQNQNTHTAHADDGMTADMGAPCSPELYQQPPQAKAGKLASFLPNH